MGSLKYSEVRDSLSNFDLVFSSQKGLSATAIKLWTHSRFSHVGLVYNIEYVNNGIPFKRVLVAESLSGNGIRFTALSTYADFTWVPTNLYYDSDTEELLWKLIGNRTFYDLLGVIRRAFGILPSLDAEKYLYCSQFCAKILKSHDHLADLPEYTGKDPGALYRYVSKDKRFSPPMEIVA